MKEIEKKLKEDGEEMRSLKAPDSFEARLRQRLNETPPKRNNQWKKGFLLAASFIFVFFFTYQFDTIAYYGKKILGYDEILTDSLSELNEQGKGQVIGKSADLPNGGKVTLDGLMLDDNQLILFYTLYDPNKNADELYSSTRATIDGFLVETRETSGTAMTSEDKTTVTITQSYKPPNPFAKELTFHLHIDNQPRTTVGIPFEIDRSKAMMTKYKQKINQTIETDSADFVFKDLVATPTQTVLTGKIHVKDEEAWNSGMISNGFEVRLKADGKTIRKQGQGSSSGLLGYTFDVEFDPLGDVEELLIYLDGALTTYSTDTKIPVKPGSYEVGNQRVSIDQRNEVDGKTEITLTADENFTVVEAELVGEDRSISLESVDAPSYQETDDGLLKVLKLRFDGVLSGNSSLHITEYEAIEPLEDSITVPIK